jgi:hypothetical protein
VRLDGRRLAAAIVVGIFAAGAIWLSHSFSVELVPGEPAWRGLVRGATPNGIVQRRATLVLPGLRRIEAGSMLLVVQPHSTVLVTVDGRGLERARANERGQMAVRVPAAAAPGSRITIAPEPNAPPLRVERISFQQPTPSRVPLALALVLTTIFSWVVSLRKGVRLALSLGLVVSALLSIFTFSTLLWAAAPVWRLLVPVFLFSGSVACVYSKKADRRFYWAASGLVAAALFGGWIRLYFLPSAGSWDMEYWKAWMTRAAEHGITRVYGEPDATPPGHFLDQLWGRERLFRIDHRGRSFAVDYPPLAMALWRWSLWFVRGVEPGLDRGEIENVAVKLPSILGDVAATLLLLYLFRDRRGWCLAALYWALPVSWLNSAVLGFLDGAYAPLAIGSLVAATRGRPGWAGALLALGALIKPQGLLVLPAVVVALYRCRSSIPRGALVGLGVVGVALIPYVLDGTLEEAIIHVFRIIFQERLSGGYANLWWIVGHLTSGEPLSAPVSYARIDAFSFPIRPVAYGLFALSVAWYCYSVRDGVLAGALVIFTYGILALGVHQNHPHSMILAFAATGLFSRRLQVAVGIISLIYVLNMLCLSGLGRFYSLRYMALENMIAWANSVRMSLGFDLTLVLAAVNVLVFAWFLVSRGGNDQESGDPLRALS